LSSIVILLSILKSIKLSFNSNSSSLITFHDYKVINCLTVLGNNLFLFLVIISPTLLKVDSLGAELGEIAK